LSPHTIALNIFLSKDKGAGDVVGRPRCEPGPLFCRVGAKAVWSATARAAAYLFQMQVSIFAHDAALHYLARRKEYGFSDDVRQQLIQVVLAFTGQCDEDAARAGLEWMREQSRRRGERVRF
jgi:hypothetical protein